MALRIVPCHTPTLMLAGESAILPNGNAFTILAIVLVMWRFEKLAGVIKLTVFNGRKRLYVQKVWQTVGNPDRKDRIQLVVATRLAT